jgi:hypothetical protein
MSTLYFVSYTTLLTGYFNSPKKYYRYTYPNVKGNHMEPCSMFFRRGFDCSICTQKRLNFGPFLASILVAFEFPQDSRVQGQYTEILEGKLRRCYSDEGFNGRIANRKLRYLYTFLAIWLPRLGGTGILLPSSSVFEETT